jgi:hypothetical protein
MEQAGSGPIPRFRWARFSVDAGIVVGAYFLVLLYRFDGAVPGKYWSQFRAYLPGIVALHMLANYLFGLYGAVPRVERVLQAGLAAMVLILATTLMFSEGSRPLPLGVVLFGGLASLLGFAASRFGRSGRRALFSGLGGERR